MENKELACYAVALFDIIVLGYTLIIASNEIKTILLMGMGFISMIGIPVALIYIGLKLHGEIK